jgi:N,N'-diacetyllegionaminate synthase
MSTYIVAEIASAHEGEAELAKRLVKLAATTGADAVKLQIFCRDALLSRNHHKFDAFGIIEIANNDWRGVIAEAHGTGLDVLVEVFDEDSLDLAESTGMVTGYKLPTSDIGNLDFIRRIGDTGKLIHLAVGGATLGEIADALGALTPEARSRAVLMHGFQSFPTKIEDTNLSRLRTLAERFHLPVGYADHVDADDTEMARVIPAMAMAAGSVVIEKHMTEDRSKRGRDHYSSLNPDEFASFVQLIRDLDAATGNPELVLSPAEKDYRRLMKRQAVLLADVAAGSLLRPDMVVYKRTGIDGLAPADITRLSGRLLTRDMVADEPLQRDDLDGKVLGLVAVRLKSSRLPRKALADLAGLPLIMRQHQRLAAAKSLDGLIWCTSTNPQDDPLEELAFANGIPIFRGDELDVMSRFIAVARQYGAQTLVRITGDNPLTDPAVLDDMVAAHLAAQAEYTYVAETDMPRGTRPEIIDRAALERCHELARDPKASEYMTLMLRRPDHFKVLHYHPDPSFARPLRLTCDTPNDLKVLQAVYQNFAGNPPSLPGILAWLDEHPDIAALNAGIQATELDDTIDVSLKGDNK